jgi:Uma2 family endonuclease
MITSLDQLELNKTYTYADYLLWQFEERVELLKGRILRMAAPSVKHQTISTALQGNMWYFLKNKPCQLFTAPFDVRLPLPSHRIKGNKIDTVVQPDLCVICDKKKLDEQGCIGAPELIVEILSPGNSKKEMKEKLELYELAGVQEYWVVDAEHSLVFSYILDAATHKFVAQMPLTDEDVLKSKVLEGFELPLIEVFEKN